MMGEKSSRIRISARKVLEGTRIGDSISTNGVCLTVVQLSDRGFEADVMAETYRRSNLGYAAKRKQGQPGKGTDTEYKT